MPTSRPARPTSTQRETSALKVPSVYDKQSYSCIYAICFLLTLCFRPCLQDKHDFPGNQLSHFCSNCVPREYPVRFGFKLVDMFDDLTKTNRGQVALSQSNPVPPAIQSFQLMKEHTCGMEFARLEEVFNYLRRCKHLKIPHEWKCLIPKPFP